MPRCKPKIAIKKDRADTGDDVETNATHLLEQLGPVLHHEHARRRHPAAVDQLRRDVDGDVADRSNGALVNLAKQPSDKWSHGLTAVARARTK